MLGDIAMAKESVKTPEQLVAEATGVELRPCDCGMFEGWKNGQSTGRAMASEVRLWQHAVHLQSELQQWHTWGIIEVAVRNYNVQSYMEHWEGRAIAAEESLVAERARSKRLEEALRRLVTVLDSISDWDEGCLYINRRYTSEMQSPIIQANAALAAPREGEKTK